MVRKRLLILIVVGALVAVLGLVVVGERPAHRPSASTLKTVPLGVSCPTATFCMAVDDEGNAIKFDGRSWSRPTPLHVLGMTAVSCPSAQFCVAGDINNSVLVFRGRTWSKQKRIDSATGGIEDIFGSSGITSVSCPSSTFCTTGDVRGRYATFDGGYWSPPKRLEPTSLYHADALIGDAAIQEVSCTSATFCAAATVAGRVFEWDGASWSRPVLLTPLDNIGLAELAGLPQISGISCASPTFCVAVGPSGQINTYNGRSWSKPVPIDTGSALEGNRDGLTAVSCPSAQFCMAVDDLGRALTFNGTSWSPPQTVDATLGLSTVSCPSARFCMALSDLGEAFAYNGTSWSPPTTIEG
jgi:hypothetical protein